MIRRAIQDLEMNGMNIELKDRKAIVTGSTAGIGRATAEGLAPAWSSFSANGRAKPRAGHAAGPGRPAGGGAGTGVAVNAVLPGPTRYEILGDFMAKQAEANGITQQEAEEGFLKAMRPTTLLQRFATTDEVANMIVYACSDQASATTGAALRVDGGVVRFVA